MDKRQAHIIFTFIGYFFITSLHRLMNNMPVNGVDLFLFYDKVQDLQWYVKETLDKVGMLFVLYQFYKSVPIKTKPVIATFIFFKIVELVMYYVNFLQLDWGFNAVFISIGVIYYIYEKTSNNR